ncbi:TonB-dependent receptor [Rhizorhabdus sp. FW153]|uniref:TonB-dependent receptor n=1 Tax=Rhizorhabdus sp. FW153 TaxID=3400216 RepID=UPI003CECA9E7
MKSAVKFICSVSLFALVGFSAPGLAQDAGAVQDAAVTDGSLFGEITVTANKRAENVQKVPIAITAYSGDQLKALGVTDATQITQQVPGLQLNAWSPNVTIFNLRGISQNNFTDYLEAPIAVYVDDAYMGSINGLSGQLFDVSRVEVLRGPQGTLFGRNATGGLIHYVSTDASKSYLNGYATASYERFDRRALEGAVGGPLAEGIRARIAGRVVKANGYIKSAAALPGVFDGNGQDLGAENGWSLRGTVQADLGPDGKLDLWVKHSEDNNVATGGYVFDNCNLQDNGYCGTDAAGLGNGSGGVINGITGERASPFQNFSGTPGFFNRNTNIYQGKLSYDFGGVELTAITNFTKLKKDYQEDGDALPVEVIVFRTNARYSQFSQELRLAGDTDRLRWQAGAYFLDMKIRGGADTVGAPAIGAALAAGLPGVSPTIAETYNLRSKNWSVFGQAEYDFSDKVTLIGGLRYSKDSKTVDYRSVVAEGSAAVPIATDETFSSVLPGANRISDGDVAARVTLNYKPASDTLLFASWNRGIKGGNFTLNGYVTAQTFQHRPETLNSFEAGVKWSNPSRSLRVNATAYHYIYSDYQAFALIGGVPQVGNSDANATGVELETFFQPSDRFNVNLGATWERTHVDTVQTAGSQFLSVLVPGASVPQYCTDQNDGTYFCNYPSKSVSGAQFPNAPRFSLNYVLRYNVDAFGGNVVAQADGVWYDKQFLEVTNGRSSVQPAYNVTNVSLSWTSADDRLSVQIFGRNVFDKAYRAYALNLGPLGTTSVYAKPATYGVSATVNW